MHAQANNGVETYPVSSILNLFLVSALIGSVDLLHMSVGVEAKRYGLETRSSPKAPEPRGPSSLEQIQIPTWLT
jgi:hypothetical protein